ncbi:hypothetical protein HKX48_001017 [Thoreauomyces humboldtii]|nr:hypothetical protein HKX48_001017 [Thoreauomyces humboldtii]
MSPSIDETSSHGRSSSSSSVSTVDLPAPIPATPSAHVFNAAYIAHLNAKLAGLEPQKIIEWALISLPGLYQTTAFGLTGLVILDMINKLSRPSTSSRDAPSKHPVPLIFIDTLHHFPETLQLAERASARYEAPLHVYRPQDSTSSADFAARHGPNLWDTDADIYDYLVKVEPARRAYSDLDVRAYFTGRRRSQRGDRGDIPVLELDDSRHPPMVKVNALADWDYDAVWDYVRREDVPYNPLIDRGYKSIGDVHSTQPTREGEDERGGRWRGQEKTECGLHKDYLKMRSSFVAAKKKRETLAALGITNDVDVVETSNVAVAVAVAATS